MAASAAPLSPLDETPRPNIPTAAVRLPAVKDYEQVDNEILATLRPSAGWFAALGVAILCLLIGAATWIYQIYEGLGAAGYHPPTMWGVYIITFVFWVGIGHAGTLISAILYLFRAGFRTSIYRMAEAMTVFAVMTAGLFPILHLGRPWKFFWLIPYPNWRLIWPNPKSPLVWDVFAILTYLTISTTFLYIGLIPDIAVLRDRETNPVRKRIFALLSLGWRNSDREWRHFTRAYLFLAAFATPLVLSVHSVVSFDFAMALTPGWHATIFPPYFVAGAIFSGFAMVVTLMVLARQLFGLKDLVTLDHLEKMNKIILLTGTLVGYAYAMEFFIAWYSGNEYERFAFINRAFGPYKWAYWTMITCNVVSPQFFWFKRFRRSIPVMFALSIVVNIGMWFERFVIIVTSLHRDFLPSSWGYFMPSIWDIAMFVGSFGLFFTLFLLFIRFLPMIAISEVKGVMPQASPHHGHGAGHGEDAYVATAEAR